jgi:hypothetical protein
VKRFSETYGYKPIKTVMQVDSMDIDLRNSLWNGLVIFYWASLRKSEVHPLSVSKVWLRRLILDLWIDFFKHPIDTIPEHSFIAFEDIKNRFFSLPWYEVYDLIQFVAAESKEKTANENFIGYCNEILEREISGWRFVGGKITPVTSKEEISVIEEALEAAESLRPVAIHLNSALDFMSDRKSPNYRNSIKESISAVEAICTLVAGTEKAELTQALTAMKKKGIRLHPALEQAFTKLYGYTSDADGIRHALLEEPDLHLEDAKFMLVACSAFINYLKSKSSKVEIKL